MSTQDASSFPRSFCKDSKDFIKDRLKLKKDLQEKH